MQPAPNRYLRLGLLSGLGLLGAACGNVTATTQNELNGPVAYREEPRQGFGNPFEYTSDNCSGGIRDDHAAALAVPTRTGCPLEKIELSYVVDGAYRAQACTETYRIQCHKSPRTAGAPVTPSYMVVCVAKAL